MATSSNSYQFCRICLNFFELSDLKETVLSTRRPEPLCIYGSKKEKKNVFKMKNVGRYQLLILHSHTVIYILKKNMSNDYLATLAYYISKITFYAKLISIIRSKKFSLKINIKINRDE